MSEDAPMETQKILARAQAMANNAKDGTLKLADGTYRFVFDRTTWAYTVYDPAGVEFKTYNTKSLKQARQWLRDYFAD